MTRHTGEPIGRITRRNALKTGVVVSSGMAFGGTMIGTVRAGPKGESTNIVPVHHFVRKDGAADGDPTNNVPDPFEEPTPPKPDDDDKLVERFSDLPVWVNLRNNGTWGGFSDVSGEVKVECKDEGTSVKIEADGLVPGALYTGWVVVFEDPGFIDDRNLATALQNMVGFAPLGDDFGNENVFRPDDDGEGKLEVVEKPSTFPDGNLGPAGEEGDGTKECLFDHDEVHLVGGWHLDDQNQNPSFRPNAVEQFAFIIKDGGLL